MEKTALTDFRSFVSYIVLKTTGFYGEISLCRVIDRSRSNEVQSENRSRSNDPWLHIFGGLYYEGQKLRITTMYTDIRWIINNVLTLTLFYKRKEGKRKKKDTSRVLSVSVHSPSSIRSIPSSSRKLKITKSYFPCLSIFKKANRPLEFAFILRIKE